MKPVEFRNKINEKQTEVIWYFKNITGNNSWSIICSCMDWLECSYDFYVNYNKQSESENFTTYIQFAKISSVDNMIGCIEQLYNCVNLCTNSKILQSNDIFNKNINDRDWFKDIRAVFGAHSTNLKLKNDNNNYFASWPAKLLDNNDFTVLLYPLKQEGFKKIGYKQESFDKIVSLICEELDAILLKIFELIDKKKESLKKIKIAESSHEQHEIDLLLEENELRMRDSNIKDILFEIKKILSVNTSNYTIIRYKKRLVKAIPILRVWLQNLSYSEDEFKFMNDLVNPEFTIGMDYELQKLFAYWDSGENLHGDSMYENYMKNIASKLKVNLSDENLLNIDEFVIYVKAITNK
ncbi:MAG: hypothetical protein RR659_05295 [Bacilli bacterium]